ncbi:prepilin peptidase [Psychrilyobacter atlanticus]|uniref:prepilin peptidase n=1 Tax=Psychrilyobacter atlanticus TaxID=271091 RepID=UPI00048B843D|nr:A24 family peptidase [Psychrilyobacter atlanticus]
MQWLVLLVGLIIGSFLNVCIYRIPKGESVAFPPSHCPACGHKIRWYENIPVFSYIFILRGKCSECKEKISIQYPIVEFITGILFYIFFLRFGLGILGIKYLMFICLLVIGIWVDFTHYYIPDRISLSIFIIGIMTSFFTIGFERSILGAGSFALFYIVLYGFGESFGYEIMGFGDVKLAMGIGAMIGYFSLYQVFIFLNIAFISGAVIGVGLILLKKKTRKDIMPFGPYIAIAGLVIGYLS